MKLKLSPRAHEKKGVAVRLRRSGHVPAVIYHKTKEAESISVTDEEFSAALRQVVPGRLSTTVFTLTDDKGHSRKALIKDIQYNPVNYKVIHLDFEELHDNMTVKVKVPVVLSGELDSVGIKLGGMVRIVIRSVRVECLPQDIPEFFNIDVKSMSIGDTIKVQDLSIPNNVKPIAKPNSVVITMVKK